MTVKDVYRTVLPNFDQNQVSSHVDFKLLVETASDLVFITDPNGYFTFANPTTEKVLGFGKKGLIGRHLLDFVRTDYKSQVFEFYRKQYREKQDKTSFNFPVVIKNYREIWIEINVKSIIEEEEVTGFMAVAWDITENIKTSTTLRAINNLAKQLLGKVNLHEIVWTITKVTMKEFGLVDCVVYLKDDSGKYMKQVAAYGPKSPNGKEIENPISLKIGQGIVGYVALTGESEIVNDTSKDDRYVLDDNFRYSEMAVPIIHDNEVIGVIDSEHPDKGFFTEEHLKSVSTVAGLVAAQLKGVINKEAREKIELKLKESEERLRTIVNSSMDAIITFNKDGIITQWNPQATVIFGISKNQALGKDFLKLIVTPDHMDGMRLGLNNYLNHGDKSLFDKRLELNAFGKDRKKFPAEITLIAASCRNGNFFSAFIRDITAQVKGKKEIEKALVKEKELNELKTKFVTMASHEFRTPLTTIQSSVDLLKLKLQANSNGLNEVCEHNLNRIENEVDRLTNFMGDLLNLGKMDSGTTALELEFVNLVSYCENIIEDHFRHRKDNREVELVVNGQPRDVLLDPKIFSHVMINLLTNSFKYCLKATNTKLELNYEDKKKVLITVADKGIGIPEEEIPHLFNSFYRAKNAVDIQGTGLGLFIVKQFVEMHNGKIRVQSENGKGSEFVIEMSNTK